jgi:hypothetical protein
LINEPIEGHGEEGGVVGIIHEVTITESINLIHEVIICMGETIREYGFTNLLREVSSYLTILLTHESYQVMALFGSS